MNIRFLKLTDGVIKALKSEFNWAFFNEGLGKISETPSGGVSSFGKTVLKPSVSFEVMIQKCYIMITLGEYAKGCVIHFHIMMSHVERTYGGSRDKIVSDLYEKVFKVCQEASPGVTLGRSST